MILEVNVEDQPAEERMVVHALGRLLGTASGWEDIDVGMIQFYDFEPEEGVTIPVSHCVVLDFNRDLIEAYDALGEVVFTNDLIPVVIHLPKYEQA